MNTALIVITFTTGAILGVCIKIFLAISILRDEIAELIKQLRENT